MSNARRRASTWISASMILLVVVGCGTPVVGIPGAPPRPEDGGKITTPTSPPDAGTTTPPSSGGSTTVTTPPSRGGGTTSTPEPGDGGGPGGGLGSPIHIPIPSDNLTGNDYSFGKPRIEENIRKACGNNELCVTVEMKVDDDSSNDAHEPCEDVSGVEGYRYAEHSSDKYVEVERGGSVKIVVNVACGKVPSTSSTQPTPSR